MVKVDSQTTTTEQAKRDRIALSPRPVTRRYLNQLVALGIYGSDATEAAKRLVDEGIRRALQEGIIHPERDGDD